MNDGADESFLSRWSRRKARLREVPSRPPPEASELRLPASADDLPRGAVLPAVADEASTQAAPREAEHTAAPAPPPPTLEDVRTLQPSSDFTRFVAPGVDSEVKNAAMKKLFADPHFNVMDGLDTYIDDYGKADPIPKSMLRQLVQARVLGLLDDELEEQPAPPGHPAPSATVAPAARAEALEPPLEPRSPVVPEPEDGPDGEPLPRADADADTDPARADPPPS